jgi:hypothetical protein
MRRVLGALALCVLSFAIAPASAQTEPQASVGALALELVAQSNADGVFEPVPAEQLIVVRHGRSGLVCRLQPQNTNRLVIFPQAARGEDVACDTTDGRESVTLYATRYSFQASLDELMQGATTAIRHRFPDARELPANVQVSREGLPAQQTSQFMVTRPEDGARMYTRASVAFVGDWAIKLRYTIVTPTPEAAQRAEITSGLLWSATLGELTQERF